MTPNHSEPGGLSPRPGRAATGENRTGENEAGEPGAGAGFGAPALAAVVAASMIGAGVWTTSGYALAELGTPGRVLVVWLLGGAIALCGAAAYGGLAGAIRGSGGEYLFLARALHPAAGFLAGWVSLLAGFTGAAAFAGLTLEGYLWPDKPDFMPGGSVGAAAALLCGALHATAPRGGTGAQTAVVAVKLLLIAAFCAFAGAQYGRGAYEGTPAFPAVVPDGAPVGWALIGAMAGQLVWVSTSYSGFNAAVYLAGEARDPGRGVPRAMLWGTAAVTVLYLLTNAAFVLAPPAAAIAGEQDVAAIAARCLGGAKLELAVRAVICVGLLTSLSALIQTGPRVYATMAADGLFPRPAWFRLDDRGAAPPSAVLLQAGLAAAVCLAGTVRGLLDYLGLTLSLSAAAAVACLFLLKRRGEPVAARRLVCAGVFVVATVTLAVVKLFNPPPWFHPWGPPAGLALTVVSGAALYFAFARLNPSEPGAQAPAVRGGGS